MLAPNQFNDIIAQSQNNNNNNNRNFNSNNNNDQQQQQQNNQGGGAGAAAAPTATRRRGAEDPTSYKRFIATLTAKGFHALLAEANDHPALFESLHDAPTEEQVQMMMAENGGVNPLAATGQATREEILARKARALVATYYNWNHRLFPKLGMKQCVANLSKMGRAEVNHLVNFEQQARMKAVHGYYQQRNEREQQANNNNNNTKNKVKNIPNVLLGDEDDDGVRFDQDALLRDQDEGMMNAGDDNEFGDDDGENDDDGPRMKQFTQENVGPAHPPNSAVIGSQQDQNLEQKPKMTSIGARLAAEKLQRERLLLLSQQEQSQNDNGQQQTHDETHNNHDYVVNSSREANVSYDPQNDDGDDDDFELEIEA